MSAYVYLWNAYEHPCKVSQTICSRICPNTSFLHATILYFTSPHISYSPWRITLAMMGIIQSTHKQLYVKVWNCHPLGPLQHHLKLLSIWTEYARNMWDKVSCVWDETRPLYDEHKSTGNDVSKMRQCQGLWMVRGYRI